MSIQFNSSKHYANSYRRARRIKDEASPRDAERLQPQKEPRRANRTETKAPNNENFRSIYNEMSENVPDSTSTIEEKQRAIEYINRMLNCPDIPNPEYWENKKMIIEQEIVQIKNEDKVANGENAGTIWQEFSKFADKYLRQKDFSDEGFKDGMQRLNYLQTYHTTCLSYYQRLINSSDATPEIIAVWQQEMLAHQRDLELIKSQTPRND